MARKIRKGQIEVSRQWIASYNREWGVWAPEGGWRRGGSLDNALAMAAQYIDPKVGGIVVVLPDATGG